jgi:hypothetical protein
MTCLQYSETFSSADRCSELDRFPELYFGPRHQVWSSERQQKVTVEIGRDQAIKRPTPLGAHADARSRSHARARTRTQPTRARNLSCPTSGRAGGSEPTPVQVRAGRAGGCRNFHVAYSYPSAASDGVVHTDGKMLPPHRTPDSDLRRGPRARRCEGNSR